MRAGGTPQRIEGLGLVHKLGDVGVFLLGRHLLPQLIQDSRGGPRAAATQVKQDR